MSELVRLHESPVAEQPRVLHEIGHLREGGPSPRTMLVATAGGHLDELLILVQRLGIDVDNAVWVTSRTPQSESLLAERDVVWMPGIGSGERLKAAAAFPRAVRLHRRVRPERVVSTGALLAVPHLAAAAMARCDTWFIESATRVRGPSATGRFAARMPRTKLFAQGPGWNDPDWTPIPGVFEAFESRARGKVPQEIRSAVVALGTEVWPFDRAINSVLRLLPDADITWQTGTTRFDHRGRPLQQWLPAPELKTAMRNADVVITHAGIGSALVALNVGKVPILLPRRSDLGEHIDDHQQQAADLLAERSLAVPVDPDDLTYAKLLRAAGMTARRRVALPPSVVQRTGPPVI